MKRIFLLAGILLVAAATLTIKAANTGKDPILIEVITNYTSADAALQAAKAALLKQKFITDEVQKAGFTAKRTTGARADYYVADVTVKKESGKIKITISFVKVGTGLLNVKNVAEKVKKRVREIAPFLRTGLFLKPIEKMQKTP